MSADVIALRPHRDTARAEAAEARASAAEGKLRRLIAACDAFADALPPATGPVLTAQLKWSFEVEQVRPQPWGVR